MKKILLIMSAILFCSPVLADIIAPQWNEIAPKLYENISTEQDYKLPAYKYWSERRTKFNDAVVSCQQKFEGAELEDCYEQIKSIENSKNEMRNQVEFEKTLRNRPMI